MCVCVCGISDGQVGVLKSSNLRLVLKNIRCDHVLSGERYNSHGKACRHRIESLKSTNLLIIVEITFGASLTALNTSTLSVYRPMQTKYSL